MTFEPKKFDSGKVQNLLLGNAAVATKFGHVKMSSGYLVAGASGDDEAEYISLETTTDATASDGGTSINVLPIDDTTEFHVTTSVTPVQATHVGNDYDFSSATVLDLGQSTDKIFHIDAIVSVTDKIVRGRFNKPGIA